MTTQIEIKFFPRDVIGAQPNVAGDIFEALFFGGKNFFRVVSHHGDFFMAEMA